MTPRTALLALSFALPGCFSATAPAPEPEPYVVPARCDEAYEVACEDSFCENDPVAYVACSWTGPYCRRRDGAVDAPVSSVPLCLVYPR